MTGAPEDGVDEVDGVIAAGWVARLQRRAAQAGLVDVGWAEALIDRHLAMVPNLPLAERVAHYIPGELGVPAVPIVHARPPERRVGDPSPDGHAHPAERVVSPAVVPVVAATPVRAGGGPGEMVIQRKVDPAAGPPSPGAIAALAGAATTGTRPVAAPAAGPEPGPGPGPASPSPGREDTPLSLPPLPLVAAAAPVAPPEPLSLPLVDPALPSPSPSPSSSPGPGPGGEGERPVVVALASARPPVPPAAAATSALPVVVPVGTVQEARGTRSERRSFLGGEVLPVLPVFPGRPVVHARSGRAPERNGHGAPPPPTTTRLTVMPIPASPVEGEGGWPDVSPVRVPAPLPLASPPMLRAAVAPAGGHGRGELVVAPPAATRPATIGRPPPAAPARPTILRPEQQAPPQGERDQGDRRDRHDQREEGVDADRIAGHVHKRFLQQLAVEAERRGTWGVRR